jgi:branched-subunit amino acid ABC-type transport system permease component
MGMFNAAAAFEGAVTACGSVVVSTSDLVNPRAFKHRDHPLARHADAFAAATGCSDDIWALRDSAWRNLVINHLLDTLGVSVHLTAGSYNSAYARFVDGLTNNEDVLPNTEVVVPAEAVAAAFSAAVVATVETELAPTAAGAAPRASTIADGLTALIGRRVEVTFLGTVDGLVGRLIAVHPGALVVAASEMLTVVPLGAVACVATWQLTDDEDRAMFD